MSANTFPNHKEYDATARGQKLNICCFFLAWKSTDEEHGVQLRPTLLEPELLHKCGLALTLPVFCNEHVALSMLGPGTSTVDGSV